MPNFEGDNLLIAGVVKVVLPNYTIRVTDGGVVLFDDGSGAGQEVYNQSDELYGSISEVDISASETGDAAPGGFITFIPKADPSVTLLASPDMQEAEVTVWILRLDYETGNVLHKKLWFDGEVDVPTLTEDDDTHEVKFTLISDIEKLFNSNEGNILNSSVHNRVAPTDRGFDNTTGVTIRVPWGTDSPPRNRQSSGSSGGGGGKYTNWGTLFR